MQHTTEQFLNAINELPNPSRGDDVTHWRERLGEKLRTEHNAQDTAFFAALEKHTKGQALLSAVFGNTPYLSQIITQSPAAFREICTLPWADLVARQQNTLLKHQHSNSGDTMRMLRQAKSYIALLTGIADITGQWNLRQVTQTLSDFASWAMQAAMIFLLRKAQQNGNIQLPQDDDPQKGCGIIILAMGKLGARELNYSSDIDLIVLYDKERLNYTGTETIQKFCNKLTHELVAILQERTQDGYVFRTDLRLRPDPASTPPAMSTGGAVTYYETVGQNWERAALIKARPAAGDIEAGYAFLISISPFIWRKYLDFAAISDIQSIKRQMDTINQAEMKMPGHNIKTGLGGIREIEFYAQINQLIWGGRKPQLRTSGTCETLTMLAHENIIARDMAETFTVAYHYLRRVEHRLQMIADEQTHTIPEDPEAIFRLAVFLGYDNAETFLSELESTCRFVHEHYTRSFKGKGSLATEGKLSFTGVEPDPETMKTLSGMGFKNPATIADIIASWHRGARRSTRTKRARELITEVTPELLRQLSATANPDQAFLKFDEFLAKLPAGVQLFALFQNHPPLLKLIATVMGSAPALADTLARNPIILDAVLTGEFYEQLPSPEALLNDFSNSILIARDREDELAIHRQFRNEKYFQAGIQLLTERIHALDAAVFLSNLADILLRRVLSITQSDFEKTSGTFGEDSLAVIALGKLGARELTFGSI